MSAANIPNTIGIVPAPVSVARFEMELPAESGRGAALQVRVSVPQIGGKLPVSFSRMVMAPLGTATVRWSISKRRTASRQMTQIANQTRIFGIDASARSRLNLVYMVLYFLGAAVGSWLSSHASARFGWNGVCALALAALRHGTVIKDDPHYAPHREPTDALLEA